MSAFQTKKLKCGVIGVGYLGRFHAQKYLAIEDVDMVGVFDVDASRCKEVAAELGVQPFSCLEEFCREADAATIASATESHYEVAKYCLQQGLHINVEKPMTSTCEQAEELVALAAEKNLKLQVGHVERFNGAFIAAQDKMDRPLFIECHRLAPFKPRGVDVSVVLDLMIHDIDVVLTLVNSPVVSVSAVGTPVLTPTIDIANARIEFESGATANLTSSRVSQHATRKFRVFQKDHYLSLDFGSGEVNLLTKTEKPNALGIPIEAEAWNLEKNDALLEETKAFVHSIIHDEPCQVSGEQGLIALKVAEQISFDIQRRL